MVSRRLTMGRVLQGAEGRDMGRKNTEESSQDDGLYPALSQNVGPLSLSVPTTGVWFPVRL